MRGGFWFTAFLVFAVAFAGCVTSSNVDTVQVQYSDGLCWTGSVMDGDGSRSVEGCGNTTYAVHGSIVSVVFQKKDAIDEPLCVTLLSKGTQVKHQCTTASYGVVSVAA